MVESQKDQIKETTDKQDLSVNDSRSGLESSKDNVSSWLLFFFIWWSWC